jgi:exosortase A
MERPVPASAAVALAPGGPWRAPLLALAAALAAWGVVFAPEVASALRVWENSAAYNHCWLILPIAAWLGWQRRARLAAIVPAPAPLAALALLPLGFGWVLAERLGIMEGRQLAAVAMAIAVVVAVLGLRFGRAMAGPLAYLVFLVPFGEFTTPALQRITARMIEFALGFTGIPHYVDDIIIEIPAGTFLVAEACAGLRFLIAAIAFGALYALVMFRSPGRRLLVMVLAVVVPIVANGLRGFGLVLLGHYRGSAAAVDADHVLYGWVFFSIVILLLILAGLPFRQDAAAPASLPPPRRPAVPRPAAAFAAMAVVAAASAAAGPAALHALDAGGAEAPSAVAVELEAPAGCLAEPGGAQLRCGSIIVSARVVVFPARATWAAVVAERRRLAAGSDVDTTFRIVQPDGPAVWQARQSREGGTTAVATWLDGRPAGEGLRDRATHAWNALSGHGGLPVVAGVSLRAEPGAVPGERAEREVLERVLAAQSAEMVAQAVALSARR